MLSEEQRLLIEKSLWVVNSALKKQGLQRDDDLRQSATLYMCECLERFDPSKNIKWSTYAYKNVFLYIQRTHKKQRIKQSYEVEDSIDKFAEIICSHEHIEYSITSSKCSLKDVKSICSKEESRILDLKLKGYKGKEISEMLNIKPSRVHHCMSLIKTKSREVFLEK